MKYKLKFKFTLQVFIQKFTRLIIKRITEIIHINIFMIII